MSEHLAEILQDNLPEDQADSAQRLADRYARNEASGIDKVNEILARIGLDNDPVLANARVCKAKELVQEYVRRKPAALKLIHKLLTHAGESMETFMAESLAKKLGKTERIDRLISIAESRRNDSLREIDRRRAVLGERLRRSLQQIEDGQFEEIETAPS